MTKYMILLGIMCYSGLKAQEPAPAAYKEKTYKIYGEYQDLASTHGDHFRGGSVIVDKTISRCFQLGIGVEYSGNNYHDDNGWKLYHLRFLPIYFDQLIHPAMKGRLLPFLRFNEGITFSAYDKEYPDQPGVIYPIREVGIYMFGGLGLEYRIWKHVKLVAECGAKGYHMSFNNMDVNPHGVTYRLGVVF